MLSEIELVEAAVQSSKDDDGSTDDMPERDPFSPKALPLEAARRWPRLHRTAALAVAAIGLVTFSILLLWRCPFSASSSSSSSSGASSFFCCCGFLSDCGEAPALASNRGGSAAPGAAKEGNVTSRHIYKIKMPLKVLDLDVDAVAQNGSPNTDNKNDKKTNLLNNNNDDDNSGSLNELIRRLVAAGLPRVVEIIEPAPNCSGCKGVLVAATDEVPIPKVLRTANVLSQFLDNDEDGIIDIQEAAASMDKHGALLVMFANATALDDANLTQFEKSNWLQDEEGDETGEPFRPPPARRLASSLEVGFARALASEAVHAAGEEGKSGAKDESPGGESSPDPHLTSLHRSDRICDATLEEAFHLYTDSGLAFAFPAVFSTDETLNSTLYQATMAAMADCVAASNNTEPSSTSTSSSTRTTTSLDSDENETQPEEIEDEDEDEDDDGEEGVFPNCSGIYHYSDDTCGSDCLVTEYFHHIMASYNGEYAWGRADLMRHYPNSTRNLALCNNATWRAKEWEACRDMDVEASRRALQEYDPMGYAILVDSQWKLPLKMPTGTYNPNLVLSSSTTRSLTRPHLVAFTIFMALSKTA